MAQEQTAPARPTAASPPRVRVASVVLDTDDPLRLGEFYAALLSGELVDVEEDWVSVRTPTGVVLAFQLVISFRPPTGPDGARPQQFHLDLRVDDLPAAVAHAEELGASPLRSVRWSEQLAVLVDPSGHPFCLCT